MRTQSKHFSLDYPTRALVQNRNIFGRGGSKPNTNMSSLDMFASHHECQKHPKLNQILAGDIFVFLFFFFPVFGVCVNPGFHKMVCHLSLSGICVMNELPQTCPCTPNEQTEFSVHVPWVCAASIASFCLSTPAAKPTPAVSFLLLPFATDF